MRFISMLVALTSLMPAVSGCGPAASGARTPIDISNLDEAWDANNDPRQLVGRYVVTLASLPGTGSITQMPWTDTYWPSYRGGLALRWNDPSAAVGFTYQPPTEAQVRAMDLRALARLSPAEKLDVYLGRFDYPLVQSERSRTSPTAPAWHGLCHGWAPAAIHFKEPNPVTLVGPSGIAVPFGSSDVKALLIYTQQAPTTRVGHRMLGGRCDVDLTTNPTAAGEPQCRDANAGSFHIILANQIGRERVSFIMDQARGEQVWNHPVVGFTSQILQQFNGASATAARGTVRVVTMRTMLRYVTGLGPAWQPLPASRYPQQIATRIYDYDLELDAAGSIIGGEWRSDNRPDFLWTQAPPRFVGDLAAVEQIYQAATRAE